MNGSDVAPSPEPFLTAHLHGTAGTLSVDLSFVLRARWTVLFGPSGSGKTTLLHALCGLTELRGQQVICDGVDLSRTPPRHRRFALVTQRPSLFPHLSARENVLFSLRARNDVPRSERNAEADRLLRLFHAEALMTKYPRVLSGGEQQRVALARAVASRPRLLLLDEALTGMGRALREEIVHELRAWTKASGMAILSVTHDVVEAMECADAVLRIEDGKVIEQGSAAAVLAAERRVWMERLGDL